MTNTTDEGMASLAAQPTAGALSSRSRGNLEEEFKDWDKSVKPIFMVKNCDGSFADQSCVAQPSNVHNDGKTIFFLSPE